MKSFPAFIAHRGGGTLAPENTIAALRRSLEYGYRAVEFDVMLSKDGVPVVMHDTQLGRTVKVSGSVADYTAQELTAMDAGSWFSPEHAGERVPTYEEFFGYCMDHGIWMNVEIKPVPGFEEATGRVVAEISQRLLQERLGPRWDADPTLLPVLFASFSREGLLAAKAAAPQISRSLLLDTIPEDWQERMALTGAVAIDVSYRDLNPERVRMVKEARYGVFCYTVNEPVLARQLHGWGVDAVCADRIDLVGPHAEIR